MYKSVLPHLSQTLKIQKKRENRSYQKNERGTERIGKHRKLFLVFSQIEVHEHHFFSKVESAETRKSRKGAQDKSTYTKLTGDASNMMEPNYRNLLSTNEPNSRG